MKKLKMFVQCLVSYAERNFKYCYKPSLKMTVLLLVLVTLVINGCITEERQYILKPVVSPSLFI